MIEIHRTIALYVALYGCETWWLILRGKHKLNILENWVLKKILWLKKMQQKRKPEKITK
jgi:hypothetical protein